MPRPVPCEFRFTISFNPGLYGSHCRRCNVRFPSPRCGRPFLVMCQGLHPGDVYCTTCLADQVVYEKETSCRGCMNAGVSRAACLIPLDALLWCCPDNTLLDHTVAIRRLGLPMPPPGDPPVDPPAILAPAIQDVPPPIPAIQPIPVDPPAILAPAIQDVPPPIPVDDDAPDWDKLIAGDDEAEWPLAKHCCLMTDDEIEDEIFKLFAGPRTDEANVYDFITNYLKSDDEIPA